MGQELGVCLVAFWYFNIFKEQRFQLLFAFSINYFLYCFTKVQGSSLAVGKCMSLSTLLSEVIHHELWVNVAF